MKKTFNNKRLRFGKISLAGKPVIVLGIWLVLAAGVNLAEEADTSTEKQTLRVYIEGIEDELLANAAAFLEINQFAGEKISGPTFLSDTLGSAGQLAETGAGILLEGAKMITEGITEGAKKIVGAEDEEEKNLVGVHKVNVTEQRLRWLNQRAEEDIQLALRPFGYYHAKTEGSLTQTKNGWVARYKVDPGPPVRIAKLDVRVLGDGADDPAFQTLLEKFPLAKGGTLRQLPYEVLKTQLQFFATDRGYFDAQLKTSEIRIDLQANTAEVILLFASGTRYRLGQVSFPGDTLDPAFLNRYVTFKPGDPYDSGALQTLQSDLINSNYFSRVELSAPHEKAVDYRIPIAVTLEMRNPRQLSFGLGYGTDTGGRGKIGFEQRWVNRWGHRFNAELIASQIKYGLAANYTIPGANPSTDAYNLYTALKREKSDIKDFSSAGVGGSWRKQLGVWERVLSLDYGVETFRFEEEQTSKLLMPGVSFTRTVADDQLNVSRGSRLELSARGADESLLSDVSFLQPRVSAKLIRSLGNKNRVIARAEAGTTLVSDFTLLPASLRFYAGGDNSVRGYALDKIGPEDSDGNVIGGKHLVVGSLELEREVWNKWSAALFIDTGDAFNDTPELKTGVGVGVRWQSPIGPIRVDFAHALDRPPGDLIRLHISIGPEL